MLERGAPLLLLIALAGCGSGAPERVAGSISDRQASDRHEAAQEAALLTIEQEAKELQDRDAALEKRDAELHARVAAIEARVERLKASAATRAELREALEKLAPTAARR